MTSKKFMSKALALVLALVLTVGLLPIQANAATITFTDVSKGAWYYADVTALTEKGVVSGVGDNKFEPERSVAYCEMIKMVINSFFREDYNSFEAAHYDALRTRFGSNLYWYSYMAYYARQISLLDGIDMDIDSYASCNKPMIRYDMAQILANAAKAKGVTATEAQKNAAQAGINDYASIPAKYQDAVKTCYALKTTNANGDPIGLLTGDNGYFYGNQNMTRAQASAVIVRLDNLVTNGGSTIDPNPGTTEPPVTPEPTVKEIQVSSEYWSGSNSAGAISGNAWTIADNGYGNGYLNNGKPITEENVIELLHEAEKIWPAGTKWSENGSGNNFYKSSGDVISKMLKPANTGTNLGTSSDFGCGGFAAMVSDYLFGRNNNNFHRVTNMNDIRPGDIIVEIDGNRVDHVKIAVTAPGGAYTGLNGTTANYRAGYIHFADGNNADKVNWPNLYTAPENVTEGNHLTDVQWLVFSRYPASATTQAPTSTPAPTPDTPATPTVKDIQVSSENWSGNATDAYGNKTTTSGNAWTVTDNGFGDGYLNNGKPITMENVIELLHEAEKIWPAETRWANYGANNNFYKSSGNVVSRMLKKSNTGTILDTGSNFACGGFSAMISDYIFGRNNNNFHRVTDMNDIRPGDIIVEIDTDANRVEHVKIAVSAPGGTYTGLGGTTANYRAGYIHFADGNNGEKVNWPGFYSAPENITEGNHLTDVQWLVFSRYPV